MQKVENPIQNGDVFQHKKRPTRRLVVVNAEPDPNGQIELKNEGTEVRNFIKPDGLEQKFRHVGRYIAQGGDPKFVPLERIGSAPEITPERTKEPADPELTGEQGVIREAADGEEFEGDDPNDEYDDEGDQDDGPEPGVESFQPGNDYFAKTPAEAAVLAMMRGTQNRVDVEFKSKECRLFFGKHGAIVASDDLQDFLTQIGQELLTRWPSVSSAPKPDELKFKGHLPSHWFAPPKAAPAAEASPAADKPADQGKPAADTVTAGAPVNGDQQPANAGEAVQQA